MARTHKLITSDESLEYDFLTDALSISDNGWRIQKTRDDKVIETMTLFSNDTDSNIINAINDINSLGYIARIWLADKQRTNAVWYYLNGENEDPKRALVYDIECVSLPAGLANPLLGTGIAVYQLTITRSYLWEGDDLVYDATTTLSALGGHLHLPSTYGYSDDDPRIRKFVVRGNSSGSILSGAITRGWWGIKPQHGGTTTFEPLQEIEDAPINSSCSPLPTVISDSDASSGQCMAWTTSATLQRLCGGVVNSWWDGGIMDVDDYIGRFLVLLRCRVSSAQDVLLQMRYGYSTSVVSIGDRYINNTDYHLIEMGEISIPPGTWREETSDLGLGRNSASLYIWAKHMSASVQLRLDCLILIPVAAHAYADKMYAGYLAAGWEDGSIFYNYVDGERHALSYQYNGATLTGLWSGIQYNGETFRYLKEGGVLVFAGERDDGQHVADTVDVDIEAISRYRNHAEPVT